MEGTRNELKQKLLPTFYTNLKVWPLLQLINFTLVPPQLQVLYINFMQIWWNAYLSFMKNKEQFANSADYDYYDTESIESWALVRKLKEVKECE